VPYLPICFTKLSLSGEMEINLSISDNLGSSTPLNCEETVEYVKGLVNMCTVKGRIQERARFFRGVVWKKRITLDIMLHRTRAG
jgi:hypothetical protein